MRLIGTIIFAILGNVLGLLLARRYVPGFELNANWRELLILAAILMLLNLLLKPILKLLLGPVIVLTLGLGAILVNVAILALLDFLSPALNIQGIAALLLATILLAVVNFICNLFLSRS